MTHYKSHILSNGLRLIHLPDESPVSYCGFAINAGTRDEELDEFGAAHFVEHMLFKGTQKRNASYILNRMEQVGGELNAYTSKEETFVYSIFMEQHFKRSFDLLAELVFHSTFPENEVEKEVDVILDEINSYKDSPSELIFDEFENVLFQGHALGHNILGDEASLETFTSQSGQSFVKRYYAPDNMLFFSMGRIPFKKVVAMAESTLGNISLTMAERKRVAPISRTPFQIRESKDTHQAHVLLGGYSYGMYESNRMGLFLLNNILGGPGMNSRLNLSLRERNGIVYNVESNITSYTDTGLQTIYFGTDPKNTKKAIQLVTKELNKLCEVKLSTSQLAAAKRQLTGQLGVSSDNKESTFLGMGKSYLHHNRFDSLEETYQKIERITSEQLLEVANQIFDPKNLSNLSYY
jgi:predicted Zn-dependent peptidase